MPLEEFSNLTLHVNIIKSSGLHKRSFFKMPDPFVVGIADNQDKVQTSPAARQTLDPFWNTTFTFASVKMSSRIRLIVYDQRRFMKAHQGFMGMVSLRVDDLLEEPNPSTTMIKKYVSISLMPDLAIGKGEIVKGTMDLCLMLTHGESNAATSSQVIRGNVSVSSSGSANALSASSYSPLEIIRPNASRQQVNLVQSEGRMQVQKNSSTVMAAMDELSFGWERRIAPNGSFYYVDHATQVTTWVHPGKATAGSANTRYINSAEEFERMKKDMERRLGGIPAGWEMRVNDSGRVYYVDHNTQSTTWDDPRLPGSSDHGIPKYRRDFQRKLSYFRSQPELRPKPGQTIIDVSRKNLLEDAFKAYGKLSGEELKRRLRIQFDGEEGLDYGGVAREFFYLLSHELFNPDYCLFEYSSHNNYILQISPQSSVNANHLEYFRFAGKVIGTAVYHGKFVDAFFVNSFYKQIRGMEVTLEDLESVDAQLHSNLNWLMENEVTPDLALVMSMQVVEFGKPRTIELVANGSIVAVTEANKAEYIQKYLEWRIVTRVRPQMEAFLLGLFEILPRKLIEIFDDRELELLFGGMQEIEVEDWKRNSDYRDCTKEHPTVQWFWECVESRLDPEQRTRLLQFVTGTSRVPVNGFKDLQGSDGPRRFCIQLLRMERADDYLPKSHTCFNRLDLPEYTSLEQLTIKLTKAIEETSGFMQE